MEKSASCNISTNCTGIALDCIYPVDRGCSLGCTHTKSREYVARYYRPLQLKDLEMQKNSD